MLRNKGLLENSSLVQGLSNIASEATSGGAVKMFPNPRIDDGYHLDWCSTWGKACGVYAANAFCSSKEYKGASDLRKTSGARPITKTIYGGEICLTGVNHEHCDGFAYVECTG